MIRRPKVQFKPKIHSRVVTAPAVSSQSAAAAKSWTGRTRSVSASSATSTSSTTTIQTPVVATERRVIAHPSRTVIEVFPEYSDSKTGQQSQQAEQVMEEEAVIDFETLQPVPVDDDHEQTPNILNEVTNEEIRLNLESGSSQQREDEPHELSNSRDNLAASSAPPTPASSSSSSSLLQSSLVERKGSRVTLKPKESPAALTVLTPEVIRKSSSPRKPRICLSSSRIKLPDDKSKVTMMDLLSYNPPLSQEQKDKKRKKEEEEEGSEVTSILSSAQNVSKPGSPRKTPITSTPAVARSVAGMSEKTSASQKSTPSKRTASQGIRVKLGADGRVVVDEDSLILTSNQVEVEETVYETREEAEYGTNYSSFRSKGFTPGKNYRWSPEDTVRFYRAMSAVGTDFTLMAKLFFNGRRSRLDLRNKFKKEEKLNTERIDKALANTDLTLLHELVEKSKKEEEKRQLLGDDEQEEEMVHEVVGSEEKEAEPVETLATIEIEAVNPNAGNDKSSEAASEKNSTLNHVEKQDPTTSASTPDNQKGKNRTTTSPVTRGKKRASQPDVSSDDTEHRGRKKRRTKDVDQTRIVMTRRSARLVK